VSLTLILATSMLFEATLPRPTFAGTTSWKLTVEQITRFGPPDPFEEKIVFEETVFYDGVPAGFTLRRSRFPIESVIDGQKIGLDEKPTPLVHVERYGSGWPTVDPEPEDPYTLRLMRATMYVPISKATILADRERRLPAASYTAALEKGEVRTLFAESPGLTARGLWKFDSNGRVTSGKIVCEKAFAPGGDGSPATFTVVITARNGSRP
jgi:hypothetical protein